MTNTQRRAELRSKLLDAAENRISKAGTSSLRARELAQEVGCSVGAIYTLFDDLHGISLAVNIRTFSNMRSAILASVKGSVDAAPTDWLTDMALAYLGYAQRNPMLWKALFEIEMREQDDLSNGYENSFARLLALIAGPLREIAPEADDGSIDLLARTLFCSIHGIVLQSVDAHETGLSASQLPEAITIAVRGACREAAGLRM